MGIEIQMNENEWASQILPDLYVFTFFSWDLPTRNICSQDFGILVKIPKSQGNRTNPKYN